MSFLVRWPDGFVPEAHGWIKQENGLPDDMPVWLRWEIPFKWPASIARCLYDEKTGAVGGWYSGPVNGNFPEPLVGQARLADIHAEMLRTDLNWNRA